MPPGQGIENIAPYYQVKLEQTDVKLSRPPASAFSFQELDEVRLRRRQLHDGLVLRGRVSPRHRLDRLRRHLVTKNQIKSLRQKPFKVHPEAVAPFFRWTVAFGGIATQR